ncbi:hypothetical protein O997_03280 [Anaplasma phagocytophilum str. MRK]|uniref:hypothetical protein n=1 Tax=Anaplasma phagocytophilum TaxID=948 RepID=UPI000533894E|nr:hypothetical protein [Anaplasma phagocytophilum]KDB56241.1 hypothetical protein O997_03280 [Anaplasma phagocytophilum str. MRK]
MYSNYGFETQVLAASVPGFYAHVLDAARASAEVPTVSVAAFRQLFFHLLTCISVRQKKL